MTTEDLKQELAEAYEKIGRLQVKYDYYRKHYYEADKERRKMIYQLTIANERIEFLENTTQPVSYNHECNKCKGKGLIDVYDCDICKGRGYIPAASNPFVTIHESIGKIVAEHLESQPPNL